MSAAILWNEARQSWRGLLRRPGYLLLAVLTLALGVATTTAVFSLLDQALLRPLPFPQSERLVTLGQYFDAERNSAAPGYYAPVKRMRSLASSGMLRSWAINANIARGDEGRVVGSLRVDRGFLDTLGLPMALGRNFNAEEDRPNGPQAVILSHAFWSQYYGADPAAIGQTLQVEGRAAQVIGVLPAAFQWPVQFDILLPMQPDLASTNLSTNEMIVARLKPGVSVAEASAEAGAVLGAVLRQNPRMTEEWRRHLHEFPPNALPLKGSVFSSRTGNTLWMFFGAGGCVLLIAAINLASLMLLRALGRSHDSAVRVALGAPLVRLGLPALAEGLLIGLCGALVGIALAWLGLRLMAGWVPAEWIRGETAALTPTSVGFALLAGAATALLASLLGVLRVRGLQLTRELVGGGRAGWSRGAGRLGRGLVIAQVVVAVVLLIGAALFTRTLQRLSEVPMGFESRAVTIFSLAPIRERYAEVDAMVTQTDRIIERLQRLPGVAHVGAGSNPPTATQLNWSYLLQDGRSITAQYRFMTPDFFAVFGMPVLAGRGIGEQDTAGAERICVVSAAFARQYLGDAPLGRIVTLEDDGDNRRVPMRVVGVVGDVRQFGPAEPAPPIVYTPLAQLPPAAWQIIRGFGGLTYALQSQATGGGNTERALRDAIAEVAPQQPISDLDSMDAVVASTTSDQKLNLLLVGLFAGLALLLAAVGLYAVMATAVAARRHEFGVRAALGAEPRRLLRQVLREAGLQIAIGLLVGLGIAMAMSRFLQRYLFEVRVADPWAIGAVVIALVLAGLLAALAPALRAARVPPMQALRNE
ncbi:ADOP family duplicated permease [Pseudoxanthomonas beigongshangi]